MEQVRILVVEDEKEINGLVARYLEKEGYRVDSAYTGYEAVTCLETGSYQLVILDLMIPGPDGYEVLRKLRLKNQAPVLILTAKGEETDKIIGLGLGADDYMTKPFGMGELIARVKALLRRSLYFNVDSSVGKKILRHLELELDPETHEVRSEGRLVNLTAKEFEILKLFMTYPRKVFTRNQIFDAVWGEDFVADDNTVMVHIRRLREKIEKDPSTPRYIQTVWGMGYKLSEV